MVPRVGGGTAFLADQDDDDEDYVNVETAGDDYVCEECLDLAESGPYTLDEAESLLPVHDNCRCAVVPAFDMRFAINRARRSGRAGEEEF